MLNVSGIQVRDASCCVRLPRIVQARPDHEPVRPNLVVDAAGDALRFQLSARGRDAEVFAAMSEY
jgi:hypothetical protein